MPILRGVPAQVRPPRHQTLQTIPLTSFFASPLPAVSFRDGHPPPFQKQPINTQSGFRRQSEKLMPEYKAADGGYGSGRAHLKGMNG